MRSNTWLGLQSRLPVCTQSESPLDWPRGLWGRRFVNRLAHMTCTGVGNEVAHWRRLNRRAGTSDLNKRLRRSLASAGVSELISAWIVVTGRATALADLDRCGGFA